jgi:hypothetical protein
MVKTDLFQDSEAALASEIKKFNKTKHRNTCHLVREAMTEVTAQRSNRPLTKMTKFSCKMWTPRPEWLTNLSWSVLFDKDGDRQVARINEELTQRSTNHKCSFKV